MKPGRARRLRTPTLLQMEAAECGAAALGIVLAHHRCHLPLERLREECGVSRDGTNARRILDVARRHGFEAAGFRKEPEELFQVPLPAILHWNFNHFVVLEGIDRKHAWINDPERGRRKVTRAEFDRSFTGPVLQLRPGPDFRPQGSPPRLMPALAKWLAGSRRAVAYVSFAGLLLAFPGIVAPVITRIFIDDVVAEGRTDLTGALVGGMVLTALFRGSLTWLQRDALARLSCRLVTGLSSRYLWRVLQLPYSFHVTRHPGDLAGRVEIGDRLSWLLSGELPAAALAAVMAVLYVFLMLCLNPGLTVLALLFSGIAFLVHRLGSAVRVDQAHQLAQEQVRLTAVTASGFQMMETLKASGSEAWFLEKWRQQHMRAASARHAATCSSERIAGLTRIFPVLGGVAVLGVGATEVMDGRMSVGTLVAFQSLMTSFSGPFTELAGFGGRLDEIRAQVARFQDVLDHPTPGKPEPRLARAKTRRVRLRRSFHGQVSLRKITFGYNPLQTPILRELDFTVAPGSRVAIIGRTGCGKSTVARILSGLLHPWNGEVLFDGHPRRSFAAGVLPSLVSVVEQEPSLFEGTLADNLTLWDPSIPEEALHRAVRDACLEDLVNRIPGGMRGRVAEAGQGFSGGERQRLELARALARDPRVLILDEGTSAVDTATEKRIYANLKQRGCTSVIIAHRLSAIRDCDQLLVLEEGRIAERGSHQQLWQARGIYRRLIMSE